MQVAKHVIENHLIPKSHSVLGSTTTKLRGYASAHAGRLKNPSALQKPKSTNPDPVQSDITGKHEVVAIAYCSQKGCKATDCAKGSVQSNPCKEPKEFHHKGIPNHPLISLEFVGALTHTIPKRKAGHVIHPTEDTKGAHLKGQKVVKEKTARNIKLNGFKRKVRVVGFYKKILIAPDLPYSGTMIIYMAEFVEKGNKDLRYKLYRNSYILLDYLPQILVSSVFFIEIVLYNQFHYFLYFMGILLISVYLKLSSSFVICNEPDLL